MRYAELERRLRRTIDGLTRRVCPACPRPCCRAVYCRETLRTPWYAWVRRLAGGGPVPPDWARRRDPFGVGATGCELRAGRYVFCYSFNCRRLLSALPDADARRALQALSDALLPAHRLPGGRLLHEVRALAQLDREDLAHIETCLDAAAARLPGWERRLAGVLPPDRTPPAPGGQAD